MTAMIRPQRDQSLRAHGLGFANSTRLQTLPSVPQQVIAIDARPFIQNLWGPIFAQRSESSGTIAEIREDTIGTATIARFYQELEGFLAVRADIDITKITAGPSTFIASIVVGVDLDLNAIEPDEGVLFRTDFAIHTSNSNPQGSARFETDFPFYPFPGLGSRRYFDVGVQISVAGGATIQLNDSYGRVRREWYI